MRVHVSIDVGSIVLGVMVGLAIAPYIYDNKRMKHVAKVGAAKEVVKETKKGLFGKKNDR